MNASRNVSRREFLRLGAVAAAGVAAAACQPQTVVVEKEVPVTQIIKETVKETVVVEGTPKVVEKEITKVVEVVITPTTSPAHEAPALQGMASAGAIPPLEERLPAQPLILEPVDEIGEYGGTWVRAWTGPADRWGTIKVMFEALLFRKEEGEVVPDLIESWETSSDGKTYTYRLRKNIKWSDGEPLTTEDVAFWWNDQVLNTDLTPAVSSNLHAGGERANVEIVDDYEFRISFVAPYPIFRYQVTSSPYGGYTPSHYMKQFHASYAEAEELQKKVTEAKLDTWSALYSAKNGPWLNPDFPVEMPWQLSNDPSSDRVLWDRNPYYWKTDPEGNQLPYIDRMAQDRVGSGALVLIKALAGEIDFQVRHLSFKDFTLLKENEAKGGYTTVTWPSEAGAAVAVNINYDVKDEVLRELFLTRDFRIALSLGIDRNEINELVYSGMGKPRQAALVPFAVGYDADWEKAYIEYNPEESNRLLDEIGLAERDAEGYRLRSDGQRLSIIGICSTDFDPAVLDVAEILVEQWKQIGIELIPQSLPRDLFQERIWADDDQVNLWGWGIGNFLFNPGSLVPLPDRVQNWATACGEVYAGREGFCIPEWVRLQELWDQIKITVDLTERDQLIKELTTLWAENIWTIGTVGEMPQPVVVRNRVKNVPASRLWGTSVEAPRTAMQEQFFIRED